MRPSYWQLTLTFFLTSSLIITSPINASVPNSPSQSSTTVINGAQAVVRAQKVFFIYFFAGLIANALSKEFSRHLVSDFMEISKKSEKAAVLSVAGKSVINDFWKNLFAKYNYLEDIPNKATVNSMFYSAGNKAMSLFDFNRYLWNAWQEWERIHKTEIKDKSKNDHSTKEQEALIKVPTEWYWASWHVLYNQDFSGPNFALKTLIEDPKNAFSGLVFLLSSWIANEGAQRFSEAGQRVLADIMAHGSVDITAALASIKRDVDLLVKLSQTAKPAEIAVFDTAARIAQEATTIATAAPRNIFTHGTLMKPTQVVIGFAFAWFLKDYVTLMLELPLSYLGLHDKKAAEFYDLMYWAGNKAPFAMEAGKAGCIAATGGLAFFKAYIQNRRRMAHQHID